MSQLAYQLPVLIVCTVGLILSFVFLFRHPSAAWLALSGNGVLLLTAVVFTAVNAYLFQHRVEAGWSTEHFSRLMAVLGVAGSVLRGIGLALLVTAVFVGRGRRGAA